MSKSFKSNDFTFRPTSLGQRMAEAGLISSPHLVREPKIEVIAPPVRRADGTLQGDGRHVHIKAA